MITACSLQPYETAGEKELGIGSGVTSEAVSNGLILISGSLCLKIFGVIPSTQTASLILTHVSDATGQTDAPTSAGGKTEPGTASIGGGGINTSTVGGGTGGGAGIGSTTSPSSTTAGGGVYQQAKETAAPYIAKAQETAGPYVAKAQETAGPYVAKAQETAGPYVAKAQELGSAALESARPALNQAANVAGQAYT